MLNLGSLPYPKLVRGKITSKEFILYDDLFAEQWIVPKETVVKLATGGNFGYVILPKGTKDKRGFEIPRQIFRY